MKVFYYPGQGGIWPAVTYPIVYLIVAETKERARELLRNAPGESIITYPNEDYIELDLSYESINRIVPE